MSTALIIDLVILVLIAAYYWHEKFQYERYADYNLLHLRHRYNLYHSLRGAPEPLDGSLFLSYLSYLFHPSSWKGKRDLFIIGFFAGTWAYAIFSSYLINDVFLALLTTLGVSIARLVLVYSDLSVLGNRSKKRKHLDRIKGCFLICLCSVILQLDILSSSFGIRLVLFASSLVLLEGTVLVVSSIYQPTAETLAKGYVRRKPMICTQAIDDLIY